MAIGFIDAAPELGKEWRSINISNDLGNVSFPFYTLPTAVEKARWLFALLSVVVLAMSGFIAYRLLGRPGALVIAPLTLALSPYFFTMSWRYLNVDIVGACFVSLCVAATLQGIRFTPPPPPPPRAAVPDCCRAGNMRWPGGRQ